MATEARRFTVGIFVIAAVVIGVAAAIWLGASRYLADEIRTVTYFQESVQGLDPGAAVKFRGVPVGRVDRIDLAPDGDLIEVVMSMETPVAERILSDATLRAQLQLSGITGLRYVEIDRQYGDALDRYPHLSFPPEYPLIPSTPSQFRAIQEALQDIYDKVMSVDIEGVAADLRATLQAADNILRDERVQRILTNMTDLTASARKATENVERMTEGVRLGPVVADLQRTTDEARLLLHDVREGTTGEQLRSALHGIDAVARTAEVFIVDMQVLVDRLSRASANLEQLTDMLRAQPSRLIFSAPPAPREDRR